MKIQNSKVKIPTLAEVLNVLPFGKKIFIEIKCGIEIIKPLIKELSQSEIHTEQAVIISFDERVIKTFKSAAPNYKAYWLYSYEPDCDFNKILDVMNDIKADGFSSDNEDSKFLIDKIIDAGFEYHSWTIDDLDIANKLKAYSINADFSFFTKEIIEKIHSNGLKAFAYTVLSVDILPVTSKDPDIVIS